MKPNVLLLVIDSLSVDAIFNKKRYVRTPNLDAVIYDGTLFVNNIASSPCTVPSVSSMITAKYPFECIIKNDKFFTLDSNEQTFIHYFIDNGYNAYSNNPKLIQYLGLNKVFNIISDNYSESKSLHIKLGKNIVDRLKNNRFQEPWISYFHIYDLHGAESKEIFDKEKSIIEKKIGRNRYEKILTSLDEWLGQIFENVDFSNTLVIITADHSTNNAVFEQEIEEFYNEHNKSESNITYNKKIIQSLPKKFIPFRKTISKKIIEKRKTNIDKENADISNKINSSTLSKYKKRVLISRFNETYNVYDDRFRIPLLFVGNNIENNIITQQVRSVDIFPTITELAGLPAKNDVRGQSLIPLMKGEKIEEEPAFLESAVNSVLMSTAHTIGIRTVQYKYFRDRNNPKENVHLYNLIADPLEENNIAENNLDVIKEMEKQLKNIRGENTFNFKEAEEILSKDESEDALKILKELGYVK